MSVKLTFVGAGSTVFAKNVLGDILLQDGLSDLEIALDAIDPERLDRLGFSKLRCGLTPRTKRNPTG